jgi:hypothetical protein
MRHVQLQLAQHLHRRRPRVLGGRVLHLPCPTWARMLVALRGGCSERASSSRKGVNHPGSSDRAGVRWIGFGGGEGVVLMASGFLDNRGKGQGVRYSKHACPHARRVGMPPSVKLVCVSGGTHPPPPTGSGGTHPHPQGQLLLSTPATPAWPVMPTAGAWPLPCPAVRASCLRPAASQQLLQLFRPASKPWSRSGLMRWPTCVRGEGGGVRGSSAIDAQGDEVGS